MSFETARHNMVWQQIRPWQVLDPSVLDLFLSLRREEFAPAPYRALAFADVALPLGEHAGESMLPPRVEARILQELAVRPQDKVLEIGTGSGFMAALLARKAEYVVSVEIDADLAEAARANLERAGITNVDVVTGDGVRGWPSRGPYDVIVVSGGIPKVPSALLAQLRPGGRLAAFVGRGPAMRARLFQKDGGRTIRAATLFEAEFPPLHNFPREPFLF
ncbi:MAG: protein-L-isoaspartate O-methyltransferase [Zoogloeaceae bacterium]|jgi:protein-L-isoaspartate(D-aspartate) O-methyltransferase|nr:protein-L-isoaspartate O-methyltransferase [Zoogloeaceae bacterium]